MTAQMTATGFAVDASGNVTATSFVGALTGNATTATTAAALSGGMAALSIFGFAAPQVVAMGGAAHALVNGAAGASQTQVLGNVFILSATGGTRALTLPAVVDGRPLILYNAGAESITLNDTASTTLLSNKAAILVGSTTAGAYATISVLA